MPNQQTKVTVQRRSYIPEPAALRILALPLGAVALMYAVGDTASATVSLTLAVLAALFVMTVTVRDARRARKLQAQIDDLLDR